MVYFRDRGSVFAATRDEVWRFVGSGDHHSEAHHHRGVRRELFPGNSGRYSWEQEFLGRAERFTMEWVSYPPVGIAYRVREGPFAGSTFFLSYEPRGRRTGVEIVGDFVSPTIPAHRIPAAVDRFFATEFEQDRDAIARDLGSARTRRPRSSRRSPGRRTHPRSR
jgi:hypothetical protein